MRKLLALSALIVVIDQATKLAVKGFNLFGIHHEGMYLGESISVLGDFLRFTFVENPGMAFGLDLGVPLLLGLFSIGAAFFLVHLLRRSRNGKIGGFHIALSLILGGAVGNLIDRVFYGVFYGYAPLFRGKVVDFVDVDIPDISLFGAVWDRFYVFNIADAAVSCGIVLLLIFYPKQQKEQEEAEARKRAEMGDGALGIGFGEAHRQTGNADGLTTTPHASVSDGNAPSFQSDTSHHNHSTTKGIDVGHTPSTNHSSHGDSADSSSSFGGVDSGGFDGGTTASSD